MTASRLSPCLAPASISIHPPNGTRSTSSSRLQIVPRNSFESFHLRKLHHTSYAIRSSSYSTYRHKVPICFLEKLPPQANVGHLKYLHDMHTRLLLGSLNRTIETSPDPSSTYHLLDSVRSVSDLSSVDSLVNSMSSVLHNAEEVTANLVSNLGYLEVNGLSAHHLVDQTGSSVAGIISAKLGADFTPGVTMATLATLATSMMVVSSLNLREENRGFVEGHDLPLRYDPEIIATYFKKRPMDVLIRSAKIMLECSSLTFNILWDKYVGRDQKMEKIRARQLVELIARLGPTAIKVHGLPTCIWDSGCGQGGFLH